VQRGRATEGSEEVQGAELHSKKHKEPLFFKRFINDKNFIIHMVKDTWYEAFRKNMNTVFTKEDFEKYKSGVEVSLDFYKKYLKDGSKILDLGCGLGCTSVPLSTFGFKIVGIDNDKKVVEAAKQNAQKFGGNIEIQFGDIFEIDKMFGKDSFDACISGGLLEHFDKEKIKKLVKKQLFVAPLVFASMPVKTEATLKAYGIKKGEAEGNIDEEGIYRNFWDEDTWVNDVLKEFNVVEHFIEKADPAIGGFEEIMIVIKRKGAQ